MWVTQCPDRAFSAVKVMSYVPSWPAVGLQRKVPAVLFVLVVNVAPVGSVDAVRDEIASPSASDAVTLKEMVRPTRLVTQRGAQTTGG
jgi:hypothetical protein